MRINNGKVEHKEGRAEQVGQTDRSLFNVLMIKVEKISIIIIIRGYCYVSSYISEQRFLRVMHSHSMSCAISLRSEPAFL